jgi:dynein heavy chain
MRQHRLQAAMPCTSRTELVEHIVGGIERVKLFEFAETSYEDIERIVHGFNPYAQLWSNAGEVKSLYPEWNYGPFLNLVPETVGRDVNRFWKLFYKLEKQFIDKDAPFSVCTQLKQQMEDFRQFYPLIAALRTPGLKDRHWETLSGQLG